MTAPNAISFFVPAPEDDLSESVPQRIAELLHGVLLTFPDLELVYDPIASTAGPDGVTFVLRSLATGDVSPRVAEASAWLAHTMRGTTALAS